MDRLSQKILKLGGIRCDPEFAAGFSENDNVHLKPIFCLKILT